MMIDASQLMADIHLEDNVYESSTNSSENSN